MYEFSCGILVVMFFFIVFVFVSVSVAFGFSGFLIVDRFFLYVMF